MGHDQLVGCRALFQRRVEYFFASSQAHLMRVVIANSLLPSVFRLSGGPYIR